MTYPYSKYIVSCLIEKKGQTVHKTETERQTDKETNSIHQHRDTDIEKEKHTNKTISQSFFQMPWTGKKTVIASYLRTYFLLTILNKYHDSYHGTYI